MLKALLCVVFCLGPLAAVPSSAAAQEVIHALTGTIASINGSTGTVTVLQDNGTKADYQEKSNGKTRVSFDKRIAAETTAADDFHQSGAYVIVFYYGLDSRTAVAFKKLGPGPFTSATGTVEKYDGHSHTLSLTDSTGAVKTYRIDDKTVAESNFGVVDGDHFDPQKGDHIRIVASKGSGSPNALFVRDN